MDLLTLKGGPADGMVLDTDRICNMDNVYCPKHGPHFVHATAVSSDIVVCTSQYYYDKTTGEHIEDIHFEHPDKPEGGTGT